jgi:predicted enzyme related to lactoylglutathione lyase
LKGVAPVPIRPRLTCRWRHGTVDHALATPPFAPLPPAAPTIMNQVVRWQIITPDPEATVRFYGAMFEWSTSSHNAMGYREVSTGKPGVDGGVWPAPPGQQPFVQLFVSVPDVADAVERAVALGAKVVLPDSLLPDGDRIAVIVDPTGMSVGLCTLRG